MDLEVIGSRNRAQNACHAIVALDCAQIDCSILGNGTGERGEPASFCSELQSLHSSLYTTGEAPRMRTIGE